MKKIFLATLITGFLLSACEKNKLAQKTENSPSGSALVKFGYFTPWLANAPVQIKVNDVRVSSIITYAIAYPGGGFNQGGQTFADYIAIDPGQLKSPVKITLTVPKVGTNTDSVNLFSGSFTLQPDKRQTIMFTDSTTAIQTTVIADDTQDPVPNQARFKFFNGIPNVGANIDLYAVSAAGTFLVASNIPYKGVSNYFDTPAGATGNITFSMVKTGLPLSNANLVGGTSTNNPYSTSALLNGRVHTVLARGFAGVSSTDSRRPLLSIIVNR